MESGAGIARLAQRMRALGADDPARRVLIGITGAPGSGKTTLAEALVRELAGRDDWRDTVAAHIPMDGFHLADRELDRLGRRARKGAPDTFDAGGYAAVLGRARAGEVLWAPTFERDLEQPVAQSLPVTAATRIVVSEGNYLLLAEPAWVAVRELFDEVWFCRVDPELRRERLVARHVQFGKTPDEARTWVMAVDEHNAAVVEATMTAADLVVDC